MPQDNRETPATADTREAPGRTVTAALVVIGNEILSGRTQDTNLKYLGGRLNELGIRLVEARVVRDEEDAIVGAVNALRAACDYVFTTGGIGPTHDDITARCIAKAFGRPLVRNPEAVRRLEAAYAEGELNEARLSMADMPEGAELIDNPVSGAPGFRIGNVFVMAGVPSIMRAMFEGVKHRLTGGAPVLSRTVSAHLAEGQLAGGLAGLQERFPGVEVGSYPFFRQGRFGVSIVLRGTEADALDRATEALRDLIRELGGEPIEADE